MIEARCTTLLFTFYIHDKVKAKGRLRDYAQSFRFTFQTPTDYPPARFFHRYFLYNRGKRMGQIR